MITINLLPEEYRRKARTPLKIMAAVSGAVGVSASLLAWWCWLAFGVAAEVETERSVLQLEMDGLTPQVKYHDGLEKEIAFHSSREKTLAQITSNRVQWTQVLDDLVDVVHTGGEGVRHYVWFDDLTVKQEPPRTASKAKGRRAQSYGHLKANGHSGSAEWSQVPAFLEDIADPGLTGLIRTFYAPAPPEASLDDTDEGLIPAVNWSFPLTLELRAPAERSTMPEAK